MQLGIIGLPQSGKTTVYKALTGADVSAEMSAGQMEVHSSVVDVPDERVDQLCQITIENRSYRAKVTFADTSWSSSAEALACRVNGQAPTDGWLRTLYTP